MSKRRPRIGLCIYCGQIGILSRDHIPPKTLFAPPRPSNLISVPCCESCNGRASLDDEYFRLVLTTSIDTFPHPDAFRNWESVKRSLHNPNKVKFRNAFIASLRKVNLFSESGGFIAETGIYDVDAYRIKLVVERIVKGLIYHEKRDRLSDNYELYTYSSAEMKGFPSELMSFTLDEVFPLFRSINPKIIGRQVFFYKAIYNEVDSNQSIWLLNFYRTVVFLCWVLPKHPDQSI